MSQASTSPAPLLRARDLCFIRQNEIIFGPLDFDLEKGEIVLVEGDNGSGKSTLLRILAGLLRVESGSLNWLNHPLKHTELASEILFLGHQLGIKADLSACENLEVTMALYGSRGHLSIMDALDKVGLYGYEHEPTKRLSAGQKKRAALARLLVLPARLWLLDEPYANLDKEGIELINELLNQHINQGGTALVTSHGAVNYLEGSPRRIHMHIHTATADNA